MKIKSNFLIYCGSPGIGKTYLCASLVEWAMMNFRSFRYWKEQDLLQQIRTNMDTYKGDYLLSLKYLIDDPLVIIDDIASDKHSEWREEVLFSLVDNRYNSMLPTIITSNLTVNQFKKTYQERFCSRLFAKDNQVIEITDGIDHRTQ